MGRGLRGDCCTVRPSDPEQSAGSEGVVVEALQSGLYRVKVGGRALVARAGRTAERNFVRVLVGDREIVAVTHPRSGHAQIVRKAECGADEGQSVGEADLR